MQTRTAVPLVLVAVTLCIGAIPAFADPVAVIASVKGRVEVNTSRPGTGVRAAFGRPLERGDKVTVSAGSSATLFFNDGNIIELSERSAITIGGRLASGPRAAALPSDVFTQVSRYVTAGSRETGLVAMAQMRSGSDESVPLLLSPRRTTLLTDAPDLAWRPVTGATHYRVRMTAVGGAELWRRDVPARAPGADLALAYPGDAAKLAAETDYQWDVEALDEKGTLRREGTVVRVLASDALGDVHANLAKIADGGGEGSPAARFLAGSYLSGLGIYQDAAEQFRALAALAPESPGPHEALGNVYLSVGLVDLAATEFQKALALQRDSR